MALVLTGNLKLGPDSGSLVDVSDEVTAFHLSVTVDQVAVPATMTTPEHDRGGATSFAVEIGYLSDDGATSLFTALWTAIDTGAKTLAFEGTMRAGAVSAANPSYAGVFVVTEGSVGGAAESLSTGKATFPMTGPPTTATA